MPNRQRRKTATHEEIGRLVSALQAIAEMKIDGDTNHAELTALMQTVATMALREWCCGDAACFNEDSGVGCAIVEAAKHHLISVKPVSCPKCGLAWGIIGRCAADDCPSTESRLERFRAAVAGEGGEEG